MGHPVFEYPAILDESYDYIASYIGSHIQKQVTETGNNNLFLSHIKDKQHKVFMILRSGGTSIFLHHHP